MSNVRRLMSLSHQHPEHGCTDLLRYSTSSQKLSRSSPSFIRLTKRCQTHVGVSEFLSPLTRGQTGISPVESAQSSISNSEIGLFYCIFLCRLLGNRAHKVMDTFYAGRFSASYVSAVRAIFPRFTPCMRLSAHTAFHLYRLMYAVTFSSVPRFFFVL